MTSDLKADAARSNSAKGFAKLKLVGGAKIGNVVLRKAAKGNGGTHEQTAAAVAMTFFPNQYAKKMKVETLTLQELADQIVTTTAAEKADLPFVKLASFSGEVNPDNPGAKCLRCDKTVVEITGIEGDKDDAPLSFDEAADKLAAAGVHALLYTSASHTKKKPRFRVLCPTSRVLLPGEERNKLVARLNGVLGGALSPESFTLSQSYYFGHVKGKPAPLVRIIAGDRYIDQCDDLDAGAISKAANIHNTSGKRSTKGAKITKGASDKSPSGKFYGRCAMFFEAGWSLDEVEQVFEQHAERYADTSLARYQQENRLRAQIEECHTKWLAACGVTLEDFFAYMPKADSYMFEPTRTLWPGSNVDKRVPSVPVIMSNGQPVLNKDGKLIRRSPTAWLDDNKPVEQMTWVPGLPQVIDGRLIEEGGWIERPGVHNFNLYRPPTLALGDPALATPWLDHLREVYPDDVEHLLNFMAHRLQRPGDKINHALLLVGNQGVGKDTLLEPLKRAIGPWNFREIRPKNMYGDYNGFVKAVVLRINEVHDLGDVSRFDFYDGLKIYTAAPPDVLPVNEKYVPHHVVPNVCGVIMTSNSLEGGIYLPDDDRRTYVAATDLKKEDFDDAYWKQLWHWYDNENGYGHVAALLAARDLSQFNAKAPPQQTPGWHAIVNSNRAPEQSELQDLLDHWGDDNGQKKRPNAVTLAQIITRAKKQGSLDFYAWVSDRKNRRIVPLHLSRCGYVLVPNKSAKDGLWSIGGRRQAVYAKKELPLALQLAAASKLQ